MKPQPWAQSQTVGPGNTIESQLRFDWGAMGFLFLLRGG